MIETAVCRHCGASVEWIATPSGSRMAVDVEAGPVPDIIVGDNGLAHRVTPGTGDRTTHLATCTHERKRRRKPSTPGTI